MTRVILTLMIKNEAAIVTRCIESARPVADAVCVCDTGSTDATLAVRDLWARKDLGAFTASFTAADLPPHGSMLVSITPLPPGPHSTQR